MINIKELRENKGIKCSELAKAMGISVKRYKEIEKENNTDILRFMHPTEEEINKLDVSILFAFLKNRRMKIGSFDTHNGRKKVPYKYSPNIRSKDNE